jgi:tRNA A-37 threonylcarbamoyl transferase component Bud32
MSLQSKNKYIKKEQLGERGKEAKTFLVIDKFGCEYAMKTFRKNKSSEKISEEVRLQRKCSDAGISPRITDFDTEKKFIVMEKMDGHLIQFMQQTNGILSENLQNQLIQLYKKLDRLKVFHGDANILNYMTKDGKIYIIDFGFSKDVTPELVKKLGTASPNFELMLLGFILKLKDMNTPKSSYAELKKHLSAEKRKSYKI